MTGFLTTSEAAEVLGLSTDQVCYLVRTGRLVAEHVGGTRLNLITEASVRSYVPRGRGKDLKPRKRRSSR